ncbi:hypothetical protein [Psychrosphaera haliotis]|uniref:Uncharacterized protein n=1 Tax=Psychrosphaera haliotis TaxID=555083 RepID=A0A6N8F5X5_9GAMM|nr:hypothetical protein [Psychrosphaera haliotis]MUH71598.1 hypothetical protein [Psychrosphaera haliotis]
MTEGVGYGPSAGGNLRAEQQLIQQQRQNSDDSVQRRNQQEQSVDNQQRLESVREQDAVQTENTQTEQRQRQERPNQEAVEVSSQLRAPDSQTIQQLELNAANRREQQQNSSGLGQTAVNSYNSLQVTESNQSLSEKIKVDITA